MNRPSEKGDPPRAAWRWTGLLRRRMGAIAEAVVISRRRLSRPRPSPRTALSTSAEPGSRALGQSGVPSRRRRGVMPPEGVRK
jgi:hypothetical protein